MAFNTTVTFKWLMENGFNPFTEDEYNSTPNLRELVNYVYEYYMYYPIAFFSPQKFIFEFRRIFFYNSDKYATINNNIDNVPSLFIDENYKENYTSKGNKQLTSTGNTVTNGKDNRSITGNENLSNNATVDFSDTPNQPMIEADVSGFLTNRTKQTSNDNKSTENTSAGTNEIKSNFTTNNGDEHTEDYNKTTIKSSNGIMILDNLYNKYKTLNQWFLDLFDKLFSKFIPIGIIRY